MLSCDDWGFLFTPACLLSEITLGDAKEYRICRLCEEREVDGAALISATNEELMELGFDGVLTRKLRMKIADHGRDRTAEYKIEELRIFLKRCGLPQYRDRLINDLVRTLMLCSLPTHLLCETMMFSARLSWRAGVLPGSV